MNKLLKLTTLTCIASLMATSAQADDASILDSACKTTVLYMDANFRAPMEKVVENAKNGDIAPQKAVTLLGEYSVEPKFKRGTKGKGERSCSLRLCGSFLDAKGVEIRDNAELGVCSASPNLSGWSVLESATTAADVTAACKILRDTCKDRMEKLVLNAAAAAGKKLPGVKVTGKFVVK